MNHQVVLLFGSNIGDSYEHLKQALVACELHLGKLISSSSIYETEPWGNLAQQSFLNQVLVFETTHSAMEVLMKILGIELEMGRQRIEKWGARIIDIDILYFDDEIISEPDLSVPHPYLHQRRFTMIPLVEVLPQFIHPILRKTNIELLEACPDNSIVKKL